MNKKEMIQDILDPYFIAVILVVFFGSIGATYYGFNHLTPDQPNFTEADVITTGEGIAQNSTHRLYAKCEGNYSAENITKSNINSTWVEEYCWFTTSRLGGQTSDDSTGFNLG